MVNGDDVCLHCTIIYRKSRQHDIHPYIVFELFNRKQVNCIQWYFQRFKKDVESLFGKDGQKLLRQFNSSGEQGDHLDLLINK
jgi:hypothetical protein